MLQVATTHAVAIVFIHSASYEKSEKLMFCCTHNLSLNPYFLAFPIGNLQCLFKRKGEVPKSYFL